jgi:TP901 family phage tail tape measure protein
MGRGIGVARRGFGSLAKYSAGAAVGLGLAVDRAADFELEVQHLSNLLEAGRDPMAEFGGQIKRLALETGSAPIEVAAAAYQAFSSGVETSSAALGEFLPVALRAAKAGRTELPTAVKALTAVMNTFADTGITAKEVADKLFITEALGVTDFDQIANSIGQVASFAKEMGISLEGVLAPMASITKVGLTTDEAFTQLSSIVAGIVKPTSKAEKALKKLKIPFGADAIRQMGGIVPLVERIREVAAERGPGIITQIFGRKEAYKGMIRLAGSGFEDLETIFGRLQDSAGRTEELWSSLTKTTGFHLQQISSGVHMMIGELGGGIAEGLGLADLANIPEGFEKAGKRVRSASKIFAGAFLEAIAPGKGLADLDFDAMAASAGKAFGSVISLLKDLAVHTLPSLVSAIGEVADAVSFVVGGVKELLGIETGPLAERKAKGAQVYGVEEYATEETFQRAKAGEYGAEIKRRAEAAESWTALGHEREMVTREAAEIRAKEEWAAEAARRAEISRITTVAGPGMGGYRAYRGLTAEIAPVPRGLAPAQTEVGGEVKITITDKTGADKTVSAEAQTKNPAVKMTAKVGKRRVD